MTHHSDTILITGGNGYVARRLARHWLEHTGVQVVLWLHAECSGEFEGKIALLEQEFGAFGKRIL